VILRGVARRQIVVIRLSVHGARQRTLADWIGPTQR
jgi:hypothetical protein